MSTTVTESEYQTVSQKMQSPPTEKIEEKRSKLTRSSSIDKINAYICSQNYYFLNAIVFWLKTSQTLLQSSIERSIFHAKSFVYNSLVYRILEERLKFFFALLIKLELSYKSGVRSLYGSALEVFGTVQEKLFAVAVYAAMFIIFSQLFVIVYYLTSSSLPLGLIFLLTCIYVICQAQVQILYFYWTRKPKGEIRRSRVDTCMRSHVIVQPKKILGNRTISNLQFF